MRQRGEGRERGNERESSAVRALLSVALRRRAHLAPTSSEPRRPLPRQEPFMRIRVLPSILPVLGLLGLAAPSGCSSASNEPHDTNESVTSERSALAATTDVAADFADAKGFGDAPHGGTIKFVDVDGDGKADACGRGSKGLWCALGDGAGNFSPLALGPGFSDNNGTGWDSPKYYPTIQYGDVTGDGRADVCARNTASIWCAAWTDKG